MGDTPATLAARLRKEADGDAEVQRYCRQHRNSGYCSPRCLIATIDADCKELADLRAMKARAERLRDSFTECQNTDAAICHFILEGDKP